MPKSFDSQDRPERFRHGFTGNRQRKLQGKEYDSWTGLYNYGFRDYSAMFGRFTSVDPIQDGHNWYAYVNSDPVSWLDPWGLDTCPYAQSGEDTGAGKGNDAEKLLHLAERAFENTVKNLIPAWWKDFANDRLYLMARKLKK
ncbi:MAG: RHS repeat-associated core domain-containing protein [Treponema sp.]|nr:RHS repeat-associated core domain-containing protein [Treponema sp.]